MTDTELLTNADIEAVRETLATARTMSSRYPASDKQLGYALKLVQAVGIEDDTLDGINSSGASFLIDRIRNIATPYLNAQRALSDTLTALSVSVGDKARFTGRLDSKRDIYSGFGGTTLLVFINDKHRVKTFTTRDWVNDLAVGDEVTIVGKVKGVDDFRGSTSTILTHCRIV
jgi:hypothetical protein